MNDTTAVTKNEPDAVARKERAQRSEVALIPPVDVIEDSTGITLRADLPGVPKDQLVLQVEADALTIEGEVSIAMPEGMKRATSKSLSPASDACSRFPRNLIPPRFPQRSNMVYSPCASPRRSMRSHAGSRSRWPDAIRRPQMGRFAVQHEAESLEAIH